MAKRLNNNVLKIKDKETNTYEGIPSIAGESAYEIAKRYGFEGTEEEWNNKIVEERNTAIAAIVAKGQEVNNEIDTKANETTNEINTKVSQAKTEISTKTQEAIESIPEDYTDLNNEVTQLKGDLDDLNDCIFNGKNPSVDTTSSTEDGVFYSCITGSKETYSSLYTGYAKVESGKYYIIQVYTIGTIDRNMFSFWNNGSLINMEAYKNYEVIDETNRIIKVKAPQNATEIRYTNYISDKATGFCKPEIDKVNIRWLSISKDNLDDDFNKDNVATKPLYPDSLRKPFNFSGKSLTAFGDSITVGVANEGNGNISAGNDAYIVQFASHVNATLNNQAVSTSTITFVDNESVTSIYTKVTTYSGSADFIIIAGGTNDYNQGRTLGEYGDNTKYTFYGALKLICDHLKENYPDTQVIFITPINVTKDFNGYDKALLNNYRNAIYEVATKYEYNVVNGSDLVPVTFTTGWDNEMINAADGCHPTKAGHRLYARNLVTKLC